MPACSILNLFAARLDSQVFQASLSTLWINWFRALLYPALRTPTCRRAQLIALQVSTNTRVSVAHSPAASLSLCYVFLHSVLHISWINLFWRGVDIQLSWKTGLITKAVQASRIRLPIRFEVEARDFMREMKFPPQNCCVIQPTGNLGEAKNATAHDEDRRRRGRYIHAPHCSLQCWGGKLF